MTRTRGARRTAPGQGGDGGGGGSGGDGGVKAATSVLELSVEDDGPGVSAANRERIFTPFFTTARERGGTGMGLAVVSSLVQAHDGSLSLEPSAQGARFVITLPLWEPAQEPPPASPSP